MDPASQRRVLDNFCKDLFRTTAERSIDVVVELANLNALLVDEALESGTVLGVVLGHDVAVLSLCNSLDQVLVALGQGAPERCVEACRKLRCRLVHARIVVVLGGFVELVSLVIPGADPLCGVDRARDKVFINLTARKRYRRCAQLGHDVAAQARNTHLQTLEVVAGVDLLVEPAAPLDAGVAASHTFQAKLACKLVPEFLTAHPVDPGLHLGIGMAERNGCEICPSRVLALPVVIGSVIGLRVAGCHFVERIECADTLAGGVVGYLNAAVTDIAKTRGEALRTCSQPREIAAPGGNHGDFDTILCDRGCCQGGCGRCGGCAGHTCLGEKISTFHVALPPRFKSRHNAKLKHGWQLPSTRRQQ